ncbi:MAG TPA: polymer-forming cytoskeletal protein [Novosphingobium sp.]|nr:polymer-forming cytoskeletal protein [Novosphingobium sp.]
MFAKSPKSEVNTAASRAGAGATFSLLGADTAVTGDIVASSDLHLDGKVDGDIACAGLVQGEASTITGTVTADTARLAGTIEGSITARELIILKTARIHGDVHYDSLTIEQGALVDGTLAPRGAGSAGDAAPVRMAGSDEFLIVTEAE